MGTACFALLLDLFQPVLILLNFLLKQLLVGLDRLQLVFHVTHVYTGAWLLALLKFTNLTQVM